MQGFQIKRTNVKQARDTMVSALSSIFGVTPIEKDGKYEISFGAFQKLTIWLGEDGKRIFIESESRSDVEDEVILDTNRRFRRYLEAVAGYTAKERIKTAKKEVGD